jgi:hypothetical protein
MEDYFNGVVGQRYKLHRAKGYDSGNMEGKDPNRFFFSGVYAGSEVRVNPIGEPYVYHVFNDCVWPPGIHGVATKILSDLNFIENGRLIAVKEVSGGRRKRTRRQQRRHKRRLTRGRRA